MGRSREGAWIEINITMIIKIATQRRSREGAWIEISWVSSPLTELNSRSREGAWIEIKASNLFNILSTVAPARERGLKFVN